MFQGFTAPLPPVMKSPSEPLGFPPPASEQHESKPTSRTVFMPMRPAASCPGLDGNCFFEQRQRAPLEEIAQRGILPRANLLLQIPRAGNRPEPAGQLDHAGAKRGGMADQSMKRLLLLANAKASQRRCVADGLARSGNGSHRYVIPAARHRVEVAAPYRPRRADRRCRRGFR